MKSPMSKLLGTARTNTRSDTCALGKPMTFVGSNLASFVCVSPDCDTGVKRPIGDGQQVIVQPGTVMETRSL